MSLSLAPASIVTAQPTNKNVSSLIIKTETPQSLPIALDFLSTEMKDLASNQFAKIMENYAVENGQLIGRLTHKNSHCTPQSLHEIVRQCFYNLGGKTQGYFKCAGKDTLVVHDESGLKIFQIVKPLLADPKSARAEIYSIFSFHEAKQRVLKKVKKEEFKVDALIIQDEFKKMWTINPDNRLWGMVKNPYYLVTIEESQFCGMVLKKYAEDLFAYNEYTYPIKTDDFLCIFHQILSVVTFIHSRGGAHRDIKPENILYKKDADGLSRVALTDWAAFICYGKEWPNLGIMVNQHTEAYAPRVEWEEMTNLLDEKNKKGCVKASQALDAYAIGCTMFEKIKGARPYDLYDGKYYAYYWAKYDVITPKEAPPEITDLIYELIQLDPSKRSSVANAFKIINELIAKKYPELHEKLNNKIKMESALTG